MKKSIIIFYGLLDENTETGWIPYGSLTVYSLLKHAGYNVTLINEFAIRDYEDVIKRNAGDLLFFGVSSFCGYQIARSIRAIKILRKYAPEVPVVWGGAQSTAVPFVTLKSEFADYVFVGRAKNNLLQMAKAFSEGNKPDNIPDVLSKNYLQKKSATKYTIQDYKADLKNFPGYSLDDFDFSYLLTERRVLNYATSSGCRGVCGFCSWGGRHPWEQLELNVILDDLEHLIDKYNLEVVWFSDASLTANKENFMNLVQGILDRKLNIFWHCCSRVDEMLEFDRVDYFLTERSGLDAIFIGIENVNEQNQRAVGKLFKLDDFTRVVESIKPYDIFLMTSYIFGFPNTPLTDLEENRTWIDKWKKINSHMRIQISFFTPYPGTRLTNKAISLGYNLPSTLEEFGTDDYLTSGTNRLIGLNSLSLPWFSPENAKEYIERFHRLFPTVEFNDWNRREKKMKMKSNKNITASNVMILNTESGSYRDFDIQRELEGKRNRTFFYEELLPIITLPDNLDVLDVGCNNGVTYSILKSIWNQCLPGKRIDYMGLDRDAELLSQNRSHFPEAKFMVFDFCEDTLPIRENPYNLTYCTEVFSILPCFNRVVEYLVQVTEGTIIFDMLITEHLDEEFVKFPYPQANLNYYIRNRKSVLTYIQQLLDSNQHLFIESIQEAPVMKYCDSSFDGERNAMDMWFVLSHKNNLKSSYQQKINNIPLKYYSDENHQLFAKCT